MIQHDVQQGSEQWIALRLGRISASSMDKIISPTGKRSTQADKYMNQLLAEFITGESAETFKGNRYTERGHELEEEAADYYAMMKRVDVVKIGYCTTDDGLVGCSPDRLIGNDGLLEIKVPDPGTAVEYMLSGKLEQEYRPQLQAQLYVTGRKWVDIMCYLPKAKPIIQRCERNNDFIMSMITFIKAAHADLEFKKAELCRQGYLEAA